MRRPRARFSTRTAMLAAGVAGAAALFAMLPGAATPAAGRVQSLGCPAGTYRRRRRMSRNGSVSI